MIKVLQNVEIITSIDENGRGGDVATITTDDKIIILDLYNKLVEEFGIRNVRVGNWYTYFKGNIASTKSSCVFLGPNGIIDVKSYLKEMLADTISSPDSYTVSIFTKYDIVMNVPEELLEEGTDYFTHKFMQYITEKTHEKFPGVCVPVFSFVNKKMPELEHIPEGTNSLHILVEFITDGDFVPYIKPELQNAETNEMVKVILNDVMERLNKTSMNRDSVNKLH